MGYAKFRSDNMVGTIDGSALVSIEYQENNVAKAIENGNVVKIGNYKSDSEIRIGAKPAANDALKNIAVIGTEEIVKNKKHNTLDEFRNEAGDPARGYRLGHPGQSFSVSAEAFDIEKDYTPAVGGVVELQASTKLGLVTTLTTGSTQVGKIVEIKNGWYTVEEA